MNKGKILKGAGALLIVAIMSLSAIAATANTTENAVSLSSKPATFVQPSIETTGRAILWDQYDTDGSNGLSHADQTAIGYQRALLDDFEIPVGQTWILTDLHSLNLWNTMQPGVGTDFHLEFWSDSAGTPGAAIANAVTVSYTETATGRTWFSRPEFEIEYVYEPIVLSEGVYWIYGFAIGPENCFWMGKQDVIWGSECWCDYEDYPPLQPGSNIFGDAYDLAFQLTGELQQPAVPDLETDGDLSWVDISAGATVTGNFGIGNVGEPGSFLNWEVIEWPDWGTWTFTPASGTGLPEGDWVSCDVTVVAPPDKNTEFTGKVKVINSDDPSDYEEIDVYLKTPKAKAYTQPSFLKTLLERFPNAFPILRYILGL